MLQPGASFDRYTIEAPLGRGGMGVVYRAYDPRLERAVALKLVNVEGQSDDQGRRLIREARAAARLDHPNTVAIFDVGEVHGAPYIAMELVNGVSLRNIVSDARAPLADRIAWLHGVARALAAAHRVGIVHRDVKPENVMLREDGVVKVLDFGIARRLDRVNLGRDSVKQWESHKTVAHGTPLYMAPEQILEEALDGRADQFAWGVCAYELVTGVHPWEQATSPLELARAILTTTPPPPASLQPALPPHVGAVIARAMEKDPHERFDSMDALMAALAPEAKPSHLPPPLAASSNAGIDTVSMAPTLPATTTTAAQQLKARRPWLWAAAFTGALGLGAAVSLWGAGRTAVEMPTPTSAATAPGVEPLAQVLGEWRSGASILGLLEHAVAQDPKNAGAHLRLGWHLFGRSPAQAREHFALAYEQRASLGERDAAMLEVLEPFIRLDPPDLARFLAQAESAAARFPADLELGMLQFRALVEQRPPRWDEALALASELLRGDPGFVPMLVSTIEARAYTGDVDGAAAAADRCLEVSSAPDRCLLMRSLLDEPAGRCQRVVEDGRRRRALSPRNADIPGAVAQSLFALGQAPAGEEVMKQRWSLLEGEGAAHARALDEAGVATWKGDFAAADRALAAAQAALAGSSDVGPHARAVILRIQLALETRRVGEAVALAQAFSAKRSALTVDARLEDFALASDPEPALVAAARAAGEISDAEAHERLVAWRADWIARGGAWLGPHAWAHGLAATVETPEQARRALALYDAAERSSARGAAPSHAPLLAIAGPTGKVLYLGGRGAEAIPWLRRGVDDCRVLWHPIAHAEAAYYLGRALEDAADRDGACAAYRRVTSRWSSPSRTADAARQRLAFLRCPLK